MSDEEPAEDESPTAAPAEAARDSENEDGGDGDDGRESGGDGSEDGRGGESGDGSGNESNGECEGRSGGEREGGIIFTGGQFASGQDSLPGIMSGGEREGGDGSGDARDESCGMSESEGSGDESDGGSGDGRGEESKDSDSLTDGEVESALRRAGSGCSRNARRAYRKYARGCEEDPDVDVLCGGLTEPECVEFGELVRDVENVVHRARPGTRAAMQVEAEKNGDWPAGVWEADARLSALMAEVRLAAEPTEGRKRRAAGGPASGKRRKLGEAHTKPPAPERREDRARDLAGP